VRSHDTLAYRLASILLRLNNGESLEPGELAHDFGVDVRTIQRDLNGRLAFLPIEKDSGRYRLDPAYLGRMGPRDVERFAALAGVRGLFPSMGTDFLRELFDYRFQSSLQVAGHHYEDVSGRASDFRLIHQAIADQRCLAFIYNKPDGSSRNRTAHPYKLLNEKGIWYLAAVDGHTLKWFSLTRIISLNITPESFLPDAAVEKQIAENHGAWPGLATTRVLLSVARPAAEYFLRRPLFPNQTIVETRLDGSILVACEVAQLGQLLPLIRYWVPSVRVEEPVALQEELEASLRKYLL
jgi:predicted DNA-binding transcriptional regulator YafY